MVHAVDIYLLELNNIETVDLCEVCNNSLSLGEYIHCSSGMPCSIKAHVICAEDLEDQPPKFICNFCRLTIAKQELHAGGTPSMECNICEQFTTKPGLFYCMDKNPQLHCPYTYHESCLQKFMRTKLNAEFEVGCPRHICTTCYLRKKPARTYTEGEMVSCLQCPTAYHVSSICLPAGTTFVNRKFIICPEHFDPQELYEDKKVMVPHIHMGNCHAANCDRKDKPTLLCKQCPAVYHEQCIHTAAAHMLDDFMCRDCQMGKRPMYGDFVWAKMDGFPWGAAQILYPAYVSDDLLTIDHQVGEFVVKWAQGGKHTWLTRGRVLPCTNPKDIERCKNNLQAMQEYREALLMDFPDGQSVFGAALNQEKSCVEVVDISDDIDMKNDDAGVEILKKISDSTAEDSDQQEATDSKAVSLPDFTSEVFAINAPELGDWDIKQISVPAACAICKMSVNEKWNRDVYGEEAPMSSSSEELLCTK